MAGDCVIGLDIGTTSTVGVLVRLPATILATASRPTALASPHPAWAEEDPAEWWRNCCAVLRELVAALPGAPAALRGICVTGMVPALVLLDAAGNVLRPSIQQSDARAAAEVAELAAEV
ncbi:MAG: FGGY family carbohydrate kinase, partial [Roseiarcus sp.]